MPEAIIDAAARSHTRALILLVTVALLSFLPGFFAIPPVDRDEATFAQSTKQMIESGNYADIRFRDAPRYRKPPGIYWMQAATVLAARAVGFRHALTTIWLYRLPSLAGAIAAVWLTYWTALALVSRRAAVLAGLMMVSCAVLGIEARLATTDAMLLLATVGAMGALARVYLSSHGRPQSAPGRWTSAAAFWTALAAGALLKGPVILMVAGLCAIMLSIRDRSVKWLLGLRPVAGLVWLTTLTLPWFLFIYSQSGSAFPEAWAEDILPKMLQGMEGHNGPPGYYLALFWVTFWPGCALAGLAAPAVLAARRTPATAFLLAWLLPSWAVFELAGTKLPHYVLPLYPSVAMLIAGVVDARELSRRPWLVRGAIWGAVLPTLVGALSIAALIMMSHQWSPLVWLLPGVAVAISISGWRHLARGGAERALLFGVMAALLMSAGVFGVIVPRLRAVFPSAALAELLEASGCAERRAVTSFTFDEPSLVFLAGTETKATDIFGAVGFLSAGPCRFAFVDTADADRFAGQAASTRLRYRPAGRIEGINYTKATAFSLVVYWSGAEHRAK